VVDCVAPLRAAGAGVKVNPRSKVRRDEPCKAWLIGYFAVYPSKPILQIRVKLERFPLYLPIVVPVSAPDELSQDQGRTQNPAPACAFALSNAVRPPKWFRNDSFIGD
jgi:hypothetical protein